MEVNDLHVHVHIPAVDNSVESKLDAVLAAVEALTQGVTATMADLTALTAEVTENGDVIESAVLLLGSLAQQVRDLSTDPAALQALADQLDAQSGELAAAVAANTAPPELPPVA